METSTLSALSTAAVNAGIIDIVALNLISTDTVKEIEAERISASAAIEQFKSLKPAFFKAVDVRAMPDDRYHAHRAQTLAQAREAERPKAADVPTPNRPLSAMSKDEYRHHKAGVLRSLHRL
jgi:hypothetical protein